MLLLYQAIVSNVHVCSLTCAIHMHGSEIRCFVWTKSGAQENVIFEGLF